MIDFSKDGVLKAIYPYIKNKDVLDVGCVEHDINRMHKERIWVHDFLREHTKHVTGIDILKEDVKILQKQGYDVYCQSAESFTFKKKFDVIFAGELIEHLSNPGLFLQQCKKHLKEKGKLIITTPNAFSLKRIVETIIKYNNNPTVNKEHTTWFSPTVLIEICRRYNFKPVKINYFDFPSIDKKIIKKLVKILSSIIGLKFKETMFLVLKRN